MHVYLMYWSPKPSHKFKYGAWKLSSLSKYTTNYRQPLTITLLTLIIYLADKVLQAARGGIKLLKAYLSQKCHASSFLEGGAHFD